MIKILKRMMHSFLNKGFGMWRYVTQQWELIKKLELKDQLVKELEELERLAKKYKDDAEERQNQAASAAFNRATGAQKDMMIKILSKLTGNMSMLSFKVWKRKSDEFTQQYNLLKKIMTRMMKIKIYTSFRQCRRQVFSLRLEQRLAHLHLGQSRQKDDVVPVAE